MRDETLKQITRNAFAFTIVAIATLAISQAGCDVIPDGETSQAESARNLTDNASGDVATNEAPTTDDNADVNGTDTKPRDTSNSTNDEEPTRSRSDSRFGEVSDATDPADSTTTSRQDAVDQRRGARDDAPAEDPDSDTAINNDSPRSRR